MASGRGAHAVPDKNPSGFEIYFSESGKEEELDLILFEPTLLRLPERQNFHQPRNLFFFLLHSRGDKSQIDFNPERRKARLALKENTCLGNDAQ